MGNEATQNAISTVDRRIAETRATFETPMRTACGIEGRLQRQRNSFTHQRASISSLSNALLGAVFEYSYLSPPSLRTRLPIEIVLSHVNRRLRDVAVNTGSLWIRIEVFFRTPFNKVISYLQRSGSSPFDLFFDIDMDISPSQWDPYSHMYTVAEWDTIMSYMSRCRNFSLRCNEPDIVDDIIISLHTTNAPVLRSLEIECNHRTYELYREPCRKIIDGGAPALTVVRFDGWALHQCLPPLTGVTSLTLLQATWRIQWSDFRDILCGCLALTHLVIGAIVEDITNDFESIILPSLQSLHIFVSNYDGISHVGRVLFGVSAPVLETLVIRDVTEQDLVEFSQLQNSNRFPHLRHLSVSPWPRVEISEEAWSLCCSVFPHIVRFALQSDGDATACADSLIIALSRNPVQGASSTPHILPELHIMSFSHISVRTSILLCNLVSKWHAVGWPLRLLQLPKAVLDDEALAGSLSRLPAPIEVKEYQQDDYFGEYPSNWNGRN